MEDASTTDIRTALKNLAREMRYMLRTNPNKDGGGYRKALTEAEAALSATEDRDAWGRGPGPSGMYDIGEYFRSLPKEAPK